MMRYKNIIFSLLIFLIVLCTTSVQAFAQNDEFKIQLPVDCEIGKDCWFANYLDVDAGKGAKDYRCGPRSYNDHKGVDVAISDRVSMDTGYNVVAIADGKVLRFRDGVDDWPVIDTEEIDAARKAMFENDRGCGNGVFVDHGNGWRSIYCHLKKDSIIVKGDQTVKAGDVLGQIGKSGYTEFPHVHLGLYRDQQVIDPFTGQNAEQDCNADENSLWSDGLAIDYEPVVFYGAGFKSGAPRFDAIKVNARSPETYPADIPAFTFWVSLFGVQQNDIIDIEIRDPFGLIFVRREITQEKTVARQFYFVGKKVKENLRPGVYTAHATLTRYLPGVAPIREKITREIEITKP